MKVIFVPSNEAYPELEGHVNNEHTGAQIKDTESYLCYLFETGLIEELMRLNEIFAYLGPGQKEPNSFHCRTHNL